ncbi:hypothetical protein K458DRAFT_449683 [Lentithecium fluviatile CBS 122367]|uniref:Uncharacterized protein n=1 Tax=Lentithecium fluviatile CBS 122367 TaxID=1168545 RepID=A0A6G1J616_9PLEO|nr:hypothetical protein K458DRAFT_449683 [Lentithecium fluviatile CBS 122367]
MQNWVVISSCLTHLSAEATDGTPPYNPKLSTPAFNWSILPPVTAAHPQPQSSREWVPKLVDEVYCSECVPQRTGAENPYFPSLKEMRQLGILDKPASAKVCKNEAEVTVRGKGWEEFWLLGAETPSSTSPPEPNTWTFKFGESKLSASAAAAKVQDCQPPPAPYPPNTPDILEWQAVVDELPPLTRQTEPAALATQMNCLCLASHDELQSYKSPERKQRPSEIEIPPPPRECDPDNVFIGEKDEFTWDMSTPSEEYAAAMAGNIQFQMRRRKIRVRKVS